MIAHVTHFLVVATLLLAILFNPGCASRKDTASPRDPSEAKDHFVDRSKTDLSRRASIIPPDENDYLNPDFNGPLLKPLSEAKIVIHKKARRLKLFSGKALVRDYPIKIGKNPVGDKERQGDGRTPEGTFYICVKNPQSNYHLSLGLSYPAIEDAERGLRRKLITEEQYDRIVSRISDGKTPPWDTPLGGEIFIHGEAEIWDWTYGCVALNNKDIEELFRVIPVGTKVEITK